LKGVEMKKFKNLDVMAIVNVAEKATHDHNYAVQHEVERQIEAHFGRKLSKHSTAMSRCEANYNDSTKAVDYSLEIYRGMKDLVDESLLGMVINFSVSLRRSQEIQGLEKLKAKIKDIEAKNFDVSENYF